MHWIRNINGESKSGFTSLNSGKKCHLLKLRRATQTQKWINTCAWWRLSRRKCKLILIFCATQWIGLASIEPFRGCEREKESGENSRIPSAADLWFMSFAWHCDVFSAPLSRLSLSRSFSSCVSTLSAWCVQTQTRFAAISHTLNLF